MSKGILLRCRLHPRDTLCVWRSHTELGMTMMHIKRDDTGGVCSVFLSDSDIRQLRDHLSSMIERSQVHCGETMRETWVVGETRPRRSVLRRLLRLITGEERAR